MSVPAPAPYSAPSIEPEAEGQFLQGNFSNDAGTRPYRLYVPGSYHGQSVPLVVMLHGCTQSPEDFAEGTRMNELAEAQEFLVLYPGQVRSANPSKCWNWFNPSEQQRDAGEPSLIAGITRQVMDEYNVDARRVLVAGLSAGGAEAMIMGTTYPDIYTAVGVHSGLAYGAASDASSAFAAMRQGSAGRQTHAMPPTIIFHGDADTTVHPANAHAVAAQATGGANLNVQVLHSDEDGTHSYSRTLYSDRRGNVVVEQWLIHGAGHAWSGGSPAGSFTDPAGPDASKEMVRFVLTNPRQ
jgi:poly(hydroxyalkanoate) depolymerase family esterase